MRTRVLHTRVAHTRISSFRLKFLEQDTKNPL